LEAELVKFKTRNGSSTIIDQLEAEALAIVENRQRLNHVLETLTSENAQMQFIIKQQEHLTRPESPTYGDEEENSEVVQSSSEPIVKTFPSENDTPIMETQSPKVEMQCLDLLSQSVFEPAKEYSTDDTWSFVDHLLQTLYAKLLPISD